MIRSATIDDAYGIAEIHVSSWQAAYNGLLPDDFLQRLSVERRSKIWKQILDTAVNQTWVAEENSRKVGFVNFGPCRDEDADPAKIGEIYSIYLAPDAWGQGYGRALCTQALTSLKKSGFNEVTLWVLETNEGAIYFYERAGFKQDNIVKTEQWDDVELNEVRYRRAL